MLVNVVIDQNKSMQFEGILDYRTISFEDNIICSVICEPVVTRSERNSIMTKVAESLFLVSGKNVYVSADLDIYCELGRENVDCNAVIRKLAERNCITITSNSR